MIKVTKEWSFYPLKNNIAKHLYCNTVKSLNSGQLRVLKTCPLWTGVRVLRGNLKKIVTFGTCGFAAIWDVCYWEVSL